ncbi:MAG: CapA family protein [Acidobacteria bacterium]|nr:MAG: CapA family protein [Acidobacteriota bacterium]
MRATPITLGLMLTAAVALAAQTPLPKPGPLPNPAAQIPAEPIPATVSDGFTVTAVGDLIMAHPQMEAGDAAFFPVAKLIQGASVGFGNMENTLIDRRYFQGWPAAENGGGDENGPPSIAPDLKKMGFAMLGHANNHDTDWGLTGMEATDKVLDAAGLVHAGTGRNLAAARAPRYLETRWGRIALVAATSSFEAMEPAGAPLGEALGRPGVSTLRTTLYHLVTQTQLDALRQIYDTQPEHPAHPLPANSKGFTLFGVHYRLGLTPALHYTMNPYDLSGILKGVREGKEDANFAIFYIHSHQPGNWSPVPADFLQPLAHDVIDAGADEFVASGPHRLRGIEIYKGKPIFYSLGNFFFELDDLELTAPAWMQREHLNAATTTDGEYEAYHTAHNFGANYWYQSVVAVTGFEHGKLSEIRLYPVDLGYHRIPQDRGVPQLAPPAEARAILERLQKLSQPYGTHIEIQGSVGIIHG